MQIEQLIPLIIILLASSLFGKKKKKGSEQQQTKPITEQSPQSGPMRKIKEMTKEMYEEIQKEIQEDPRREPQAVPTRSLIETSIKPLNVPIPSEVSRSKTSKTRRNRRTVSARKTSEKKQMISANNIVPKDGNDLIKGIVFSEIYGPPISKR